jgi:hypothetical protein
VCVTDHPHCHFSKMGPLRSLPAAAAPFISTALGGGIVLAPRCHGFALSAAASNDSNGRLRRLPAKWGIVALSCSSRSVVADACTVEWNDNPSDASSNERRFSARTFASSDCWGRRPLLVRGAFDPDLLSGRVVNEDDDDGEEDAGGGLAAPACPAWPSWEEVVEIAADLDSESR